MSEFSKNAGVELSGGCSRPRVPWKVRCSSRWKSRPGKGRPIRVAIPAVVEVTKRSELCWSTDSECRDLG
jgi:hypothetical protein